MRDSVPGHHVGFVLGACQHLRRRTWRPKKLGQAMN
jgi:hypothetical protein